MQATAVQHRHNLASEMETQRHNLATEAQERRNLSEVIRNNKAILDYDYANLAEQSRRNLNEYSTKLIELNNKLRHDMITEQQARDELEALNKRFNKEQAVKLLQTAISEGRITITGPFKTGISINAQDLTSLDLAKLFNSFTTGEPFEVGYDPTGVKRAQERAKEQQLTKDQRLQKQINKLTDRLDREIDPKIRNNIERRIDKLYSKMSDEKADITKEEAYENAKRKAAKFEISGYDLRGQAGSERQSNSISRNSVSENNQGPGQSLENSELRDSSNKTSKIIYSGSRNEQIGPGVQ